MSKVWKRIDKGTYATTQGFAQGIIEKSVRGFWWWLVCDEKGVVLKADRALRLKDAKKEAWAVVNKHSLKLITGGGQF